MTTKIPTKHQTNEQFEINITSKDFPVTPAIEDKLHEKLSSLEKFAKGRKTAKVNLHGNTDGYTVEVALTLEKAFLKMDETSEDLYHAIDTVVEKMKNQLSKLAKVSTSRQNRASIRTTEPISQVVQPEPESEIVVRKEVSAKPMFEEEAVEQMKAMGHQSFVFINAETFKPSMIYKRNDGNFGLIDMV